MQNTFSNALSEAISKHIALSTTRRETLTWLALLIMRQGTICLWRLAAHVVTSATTDSVRRRFYRFFQHVPLDGAMTARVVVDLLGIRGKPWVLAMDRPSSTASRTVVVGDVRWQDRLAAWALIQGFDEREREPLSKRSYRIGDMALGSQRWVLLVLDGRKGEVFRAAWGPRGESPLVRG
jgi:hypothetical protein